MARPLSTYAAKKQAENEGTKKPFRFFGEKTVVVNTSGRTEEEIQPEDRPGPQEARVEEICTVIEVLKSGNYMLHTENRQRAFLYGSLVPKNKKLRLSESLLCELVYDQSRGNFRVLSFRFPPPKK
jgi:hypothetical protein